MVNANNVCTYIEEATIDLLKKKKLKDITIMEVVKKAGVCRALFIDTMLTQKTFYILIYHHWRDFLYLIIKKMQKIY